MTQPTDISLVVPVYKEERNIRPFLERAERALDKMQTRKELYDLLEYDPMAESWPGYESNHRNRVGRDQMLNELA